MQLIINTPGSYLHVKDDMFEIKNGEDKHQISPLKIRTILLTTNAALSTNAIQLALVHKIDIVFLEPNGQPYARCWLDRMGSTAKIRRKQLELSQSAQGIEIGASFVIQKLTNQLHWLKKIRNQQTRRSNDITQVCNSIERSISDINAIRGSGEQARNIIMGIEGANAHKYWRLLSSLLPQEYRFNGRSRNPATDPFNCLLNYAYGVLYSEVERACIIAGVDPYIGFLHTDHYAKVSMVLDIIESYRQYADEAVYLFIKQKRPPLSDFDQIPGGLYLNKDGKAHFLEFYQTFLDTHILYQNKRITRRRSIQMDLHHLANQWLQII